MDGLIIMMVGFALFAGPAALIWAVVLTRKVRALRIDVDLVLKRQPATEPPVKVDVPPPLPVEVVEEEPPAPEEYVPEETVLEEPPVQVPVMTEAEEPPSSFRWEKFIGMKALNWAGVITSLFGVALVLKVAFDEGWLGEWGISLMVYAAGIAFIGTGHFLRRRGLGIAAEGLSALGFGVLYAASFCAHNVFGLYSSEAAFAIMAATTLCGGLLSMFYRSEIVAGLIFLGGYLTPVLLSTGEDHGGFLTAYLTLLGCGALALNTAFGWRYVKLFCPAATYIIFLLWYQSFGHARMEISILGTTIFLVLFSLMYLLPVIARKAKDRTEDVVLGLFNGLVGFAFLFDILYADHRLAMALTTLGLSAFFFAQVIVLRRAGRKESPLTSLGVVLSLGFLTAAVPIKLDAWTTAVVWAMEGTILTAMARSTKNRWVLYAGVASHLLAVMELLLNLPLHEETFSPVFNSGFCAWILVIVAVAAAAWLWAREKKVALIIYAVGAGLLAYSLGALEIVNHFDLNLGLSELEAVPYVWLVGIGLSILFLVLRLSVVGVVFFTITSTLLLASIMPYHHERFDAIMNPFFLCGLALPVSLLIAARVEWNAGVKEIRMIYAASAGLIALILVGVEILAHFEFNLQQSTMLAMPYIWLTGASISLLYTIVAGRIRESGLNYLGIAANLVTAGIFFLTFGFYHTEAFTAVANPMFLCGLALALSMALSARLQTFNAATTCWSLFVVILFSLFSMETYQFFFHHPELARWALGSLTVLWALFGAALLVVGVVKRIPAWRYTALGLFGLTLGKVFLLDTASLEPLYRVLGFLTLGGVLMAGSFAYTRFLRNQEE